MNVPKPDRGSYPTQDFRLWHSTGGLEISPKFQRRSVWRTPIRSFFIDTLLRGMTVPPIYLRITQDLAKQKIVREVVDGQQRIRSILEFVDDGYKLAKTLHASWAGKRFSELTQDEKDRINGYPFPCETFNGISDQEVLELFCRLNMYGVPLNNQELLNGQFFGLFKQACLDLALEYLEFWRLHKIFSEIGIARMMEVELASELLIAGSSGMQDKKKSIHSFYEMWDESYPDRKRDEKRFREVMGTISETFSSASLAQTEFRRPPMFYTLYCVVYHHLYGLPKILRHSPRKGLTADNRDSLREAVTQLSDIIAQSKDKAIKTPKKYQAFVQASSRQTDNIRPRNERFNKLFETAF